MSVPITKARMLLSLTTSNGPVGFYRPGEHSNAPMAMMTTFDGAPTGFQGILNFYQVVNGANRYIRQGGLNKKTNEVFVASAPNTRAQSGTTSLPVVPTSVTITTSDGTGGGTGPITDDGNGNIVQNGTAIGTINYFTGAISLTFAVAVTAAASVRASYQPAVIFKEGVKLIDIDGFAPNVPIVYDGICNSTAGTAQGWGDLIGHWT
jgi:hypothetical protein